MKPGGWGVEDYAVLSHAGHGVNSYAIQYYLVHGFLHMFLHLGWGGAYMDAEATAARIRDCFSLADQVVEATQGMPGFRAGERLIVVGSDFYGGYWLPPRVVVLKQSDCLCSRSNKQTSGFSRGLVFVSEYTITSPRQ